MFNFRFASSLSLNPPPPSPPSDSQNPAPQEEDGLSDLFRFSPSDPRTHDMDCTTTLYVFWTSWATLNLDPTTYLPTTSTSVLQSSRECRSSDVIHPFLAFGKEVYIEEHMRWFTVTNVYTTPESVIQDSYRVWLSAQVDHEYMHLVMDVPSQWVIMNGNHTPELAFFRPRNPEPIPQQTPHTFRSFPNLRRVYSNLIGRPKEH